jgi:peptide/nickel transport system substrate-binding protein
MAHEGGYRQVLRGRRLGRRRLLAMAGAASATTAFLAACGGGDGKATTSGTTRDTTSATGTAAATPRKGGELLLAQGDPGSQSLDPHITLNAAFFYWGLISNLLMYADPKKVEPIQPGLVAKWEQPDKDTILLTVRQGVKWHAAGKPTNGRPLVARDVAFNLNRISGLLDPQRIAQFQRRSDFEGMDKAEAVDDTTVRVTFKEPNSAFINGMADWRNWVVAEETVQKDPNFKDPVNWAGTGPFIIDSWDSSTSTGRYVANPTYWEQGLPYLAGVQQVQFPDAAASMSAFLSGKVDFRSAFSEEDRDQIKKGRADAKIVVWEHSGWEYFRLDQRKSAFPDVRVRKALFLAINYQELLDANYGPGYYDFTGPLVSGFPGTWTSDEIKKMAGWNSATKQQDIAEAKRLMEAAGFPTGNIEFGITTSGSGPWDNNAVRIKDQLQKIWPAMRVSLRQTTDGADFARRLGTGDYESITYGSFPPPATLLEATLHYKTNGGRNYTRFSDAEVDRLITAGNQEFDAAARNRIIGQLQQRLLDTIYVIPIGKRRGVFAHQARVQNFEGFSGPGTFESYDPNFAAKQLWLRG